LSYSSRISSFWAVVKCPRLEERDGTSKDITDFSPRQYCQITVTRQPDTEGVHSGLGAPALSRHRRGAGGPQLRSVCGDVVSRVLCGVGSRWRPATHMSGRGHRTADREQAGTTAEQ